MEKKLRGNIHEAILDLTANPPEGDIKPLQGNKDGCFRLRVGSWRVIYRYDDDGAMIVLYIMDIGPRGDIYKWPGGVTMSELAQKTAIMIDMLPANEQRLAYEMLKRIVLAWDPDFTKLTPREAAALEEAEAEIARGETVDDDAIDWGAE